MSQSQPDGYLVTPATGTGPGVLVLHAWWGLNDTIKLLCRRLADAGFVAFAPDLYHGKVADTIPGATALSQAIDADPASTKTLVEQSAKFLIEHTGGAGIAVMGFSLGAYFSVYAASANPDYIYSVILFYGTGDADLSHTQAAFLGHFAEHDPYEPDEYAARLEAYLKRIGRPVVFHRYQGTGHWFFEPDRVDAYNEAAAKLAWDRTLNFLKHGTL